ncbi:MAG TPA: 2-C-methyl-D-erythritol 2,4-cyclodiphosphate synthase [Candidatus Omnitrophica bacterium]|nr:2-C-methyl-D-erythritol 2,4-cyclodiphosphate synthase [Candidatus Omnitrophota bacterium]
MYRVGIGYDIHKLVKGRKLIIGGVKIPHAKGLFGHSDADVLVHAISDAILGACGLPDIGELFPDTDIRFKNISSIKLLEVIQRKITRNFKIVSIDSIIIIQEPRIMPYKKVMRKNIAAVLGIDIGSINIKGKTGENLSDPIGRKAAIAVHAVALVKRKK